MSASVSTLLQPISADQPGGEDLSFSPEFDLIAAARRADDPTLEQGAWQTEIKSADWTQVEKLCLELLQRRTKDLRVAGWLAEAWTQRSGLVGLADGLELLTGLLSQFWDQLQPALEQGDLEGRYTSLNWLNQRLAGLVLGLPLADDGERRASALDWTAAQALQRQMDAEQDEPVDLAGRLTLAQLDALRARTPSQFYLRAYAEYERIQRALPDLAAAAQHCMGDEAPSFSALAQALEAHHEALKRLAPAHSGSNSGQVAGGGLGVDSAAQAAAGSPVGPIASRAQALDLLRQVARYFRTTEPHSPVAYLADKAARWGEMPLDAWLRTVLKDEGALAHVEELLGLERRYEETK